MNLTGFNNREKAFLENLEPMKMDFEIDFTFLWAVQAKPPINARYDSMDIISKFEKLCINL